MRKALSPRLEAVVLAALDSPLLMIEPIPVDRGPEDLEELLELTADESGDPWTPGWAREVGTGRQVLRMPVWIGASKRTIWSSPTVNYAFRAWHDHLHILHCAGFDPSGEFIVAKAHERALRGTEADNPGDRLILRAETQGQILYHQRWDRFPTDQRAFVVRCVRKGILASVEEGGL